MPIYEFECASHGRFDELRSFAEASTPAACPVCAGACERIVSLPTISGMAPATRKAHETNERSRHAPTRHAGALDTHPVFGGKAKRGHVCNASCNHGGKAAAEQAKSQAFTQYAGPRPWVIEHTQGTTVG